MFKAIVYRFKNHENDNGTLRNPILKDWKEKEEKKVNNSLDAIRPRISLV